MKELQPFGRILALDVGRKRIGLAISDELGITCRGLETLHRTATKSDLEKLAQLIAEWQIVLLVVGNPIHMDGTPSKQSEYTKALGDRLSKITKIPVVYLDERLTSREAEQTLREAGKNVRDDKSAIDRVSAMIILENYLQSPAFEERQAAQS